MEDNKKSLLPGVGKKRKKIRKLTVNNTISILNNLGYECLIVSADTVKGMIRAESTGVIENDCIGFLMKEYCKFTYEMKSNDHECEQDIPLAGIDRHLPCNFSRLYHHLLSWSRNDIHSSITHPIVVGHDVFFFDYKNVTKNKNWTKYYRCISDVKSIFRVTVLENSRNEVHKMCDVNFILSGEDADILHVSLEPFYTTRLGKDFPHDKEIRYIIPASRLIEEDPITPWELYLNSISDKNSYDDRLSRDSMGTILKMIFNVIVNENMEEK